MYLTDIVESAFEKSKTKKQTYYVRLRRRPYIHTCRLSILRPQAARLYRHAIYGSSSHPELYFWVGGRFVRFWASGGAKFPKMGDFLPRTHM